MKLQKKIHITDNITEKSNLLFKHQADAFNENREH